MLEYVASYVTLTIIFGHVTSQMAMNLVSSEAKCVALWGARPLYGLRFRLSLEY
jgi:hypothetical protein